MTSNIPKLKSLSAKLLTLESEYSNFWQLCPAIFVVTTEGVITKVNKEWTACLGYDEKETIGRCLCEFTDPGSEAKMEDSRVILKEGEAIRNRIVKYMHKQGYPVYISWNENMDNTSGVSYAAGMQVDCMTHDSADASMTSKKYLIYIGED